MPVKWLDPRNPLDEFPPASEALQEPEGLLAAGGDLHPQRLLHAYRQGIFPWYEDGQPILWWSPDPRALIFTDRLKISRSLQKTLRNKDYRVSINTRFEEVVRACAAPRKGASGTWITNDMRRAYLQLHRMRHAYSIEVWNPADELVGGLYGILLDNMFCGESMFNRATDMSKVALVYLAYWLEEQGIRVIDCQLPNPHLKSLGAESIPRDEFISRYVSPSKES
ncbi:MAG: leucyl/phenylalanyl-tRNA--protein transferase [bacterium]